MARKKLRLSYITNDSARRAAFNKSRNSLMRKVSELSTLCGVDACAIVYAPHDQQPSIWPSQPEAHRVLMRLPEIEQRMRQLNQKCFKENQIEQINDQCKKLKRQNRYMEINEILNQSLGAGKCLITDVHDHSVIGDLTWLLDEKKKEVECKLSKLKMVNNLAGGDQYVNNHMMMEGGGVSPPSYNEGALGDVNNNNDVQMMPTDNPYVHMNDINTSMKNIDLND
ncbi:hypothetical protein MKW94_012179 [Papaver nudicaule]|uniref:MADS-box domain-containing protein n=1 Tax=Papaver nudicaule TaxID=74823 RepID=A0AA41VEN0_PAPNU|nr:hypothetical protein [Papaver nudicaule]